MGGYDLSKSSESGRQVSKKMTQCNKTVLMNPQIQVLEISKVEVHSDYDSDRIENDIALIRLDRKAALSRETFLEYLLITIYEYLLVLWLMSYDTVQQFIFVRVVCV